MSRSSVVLSALSDELATTSELYDRVGYLELTRVGLIPYARFREELERLVAAGLAQRESAEDGSTQWKLSDPGSAGPG